MCRRTLRRDWIASSVLSWVWIGEPARHGLTRNAMCILAMLNLNNSSLPQQTNTLTIQYQSLLACATVHFSESPADDLHEELAVIDPAEFEKADKNHAN